MNTHMIIRMDIHTRTHTHIHTPTPTPTPTRVRTYTHTHTHTKPHLRLAAVAASLCVCACARKTLLGLQVFASSPLEVLARIEGLLVNSHPSLQAWITVEQYAMLPSLFDIPQASRRLQQSEKSPSCHFCKARSSEQRVGDGCPHGSRSVPILCGELRRLSLNLHEQT